MTAVAYPATLPNPTRLIHRPNMRAVISDLPGRPALASKERSYSGAADVEWFLNSAQAAEFYAWWNDVLRRGGYWFNTSWPAILPGLNTCQFITDPVFSHVYNGAFKVSATVQVRSNSGDLLAPVSGDALYGNVVLLLLGNDANGSTTFTDSSAYARSMTTRWYGGTQPINSNAQSVFGNTAIYGGNPGNNNALWTAATGGEWVGDDFCVDGWVWRGLNASYFGLGMFRNENDVVLFKTPVDSGNYEISVGLDGPLALTSTTQVPLGTWTHFAVSWQKVGGNSVIRLFINGVQEATTTVPVRTSISYTNFKLGTSNSGGFEGINGYINGYRVTVGNPRWTANFTPPATLAEYAPAS